MVNLHLKLLLWSLISSVHVTFLRLYLYYRRATLLRTVPNKHLSVGFLCVMTLPEVPFKIKYSSYALSNIIPRGSHNPEKLQYVLEAQTKALKEGPFCLHQKKKKRFLQQCGIGNVHEAALIGVFNRLIILTIKCSWLAWLKYSASFFWSVQECTHFFLSSVAHSNGITWLQFMWMIAETLIKL